jgi:hypothetical protein
MHYFCPLRLKKITEDIQPRHRGYIHISLLYIRWALFPGRKNQLAHA